MSGKIIAEVGSVHDGSFGNALKLVELATSVGADCVKFQMHLADSESLLDAPSPYFFSDEGRVEYFNRTSFSEDQWIRLKEHSDNSGIEFLCSPFSIEAVEILERVGVSAYKIPSGEVTNIPMLERVVATGKPIYLSTGMSSWAEIERALEVCSDVEQLVLMQCTSQYPCELESVGINVLAEMNERFGNQVVLGFSDHTTGLVASIAAATVGARIIEKHLTFSRKMYGSDASNATEPEEFGQLVKMLRQTWNLIEHKVDKDDLSPVTKMKEIFEKSIVSARELTAGSKLHFEDLAFKKPGTGISAREYQRVIGRVVKRNLPANQKLSFEDLE